MKYRSLFISDLHLGSTKSRSDSIISFLRLHDFEYIYLVGDIIDIWSLRRKKHWPQLHTDIVRKILKRSKYSKVYYVIGNHDEFLLNFTDLVSSFGNITFAEEVCHTTVDGRRLLVVHGHQFDGVTKYAPIIAYLGDYGYEILVSLTKWYHKLCRIFGWEYRSLSSYVKSRVKQAINFICDYEESVVHYVERNKGAGVICGHIHHCAKKEIRGIEYYNCGDWVDSCSALVEDFDGNILLLKDLY